MPFDYRKLKGRIIEMFGSQSAFSKALCRSERTVSLKLNGKIPWTQVEICNAAKLLKIDISDIQEYFFNY